MSLARRLLQFAGATFLVGATIAAMISIWLVVFRNSYAEAVGPLLVGGLLVAIRWGITHRLRVSGE